MRNTSIEGRWPVPGELLKDEQGREESKKMAWEQNA